MLRSVLSFILFCCHFALCWAVDFDVVVLHHFDKEDFIYASLADAGFSEIKTIPDELDHVYPGFEEWFASFWTHARRGFLEKLTPEQLSRFKEILSDRISPNLKSDGLHELLSVFYTQALKPNPLSES